MGERAANPSRWWLPSCGCAAAAIVVLPSMIFGNDFGAFVLTGVLEAVISLIVLVVLFLTIRHRRLAALLMLAVFGAGTWILFKTSDDVHTIGSWLIRSSKYKAEILAQPNPMNRELKHAEWDSWGIAGMDTTVYLVFDPDDSLRGAAESHSPGKYAGIPCEVFRVRRLEKRWYTVQFYTNTDWRHCS